MNLFLKYLSLFGMAMLPVLELRGSVPWGVAQDLNYAMVLAVSILGHMVPVPFIMLFIRRIFDWMKKKSRRLAAIAEKLEARAQSKGDILVKYETLGLFILVAIPLPGTGAWTGTLAASFLNMGIKTTSLAVSLGVVIAGIIMGVVSLTGVHVFGL